MTEREPCRCGRIHGSVIGSGTPAGGPPAGSRPDDPVRAIAEALWNIGQGYTVEDVASIGGDGRVDWCLLNADDVADEALHMGHARQVLDHLTAAGWGSCASRCRHHDGTCSGIVDANEAMGEALTAARAEAERERAVTARLRRVLSSSDVGAAAAEAVEEVERLRGLLGQACDEIDDLTATIYPLGDQPSEVAANLREQGGIRRG